MAIESHQFKNQKLSCDFMYVAFVLQYKAINRFSNLLSSSSCKDLTVEVG